MIRNYLIIAFRNIKRYSVHSILNISGMAIAMASAILALLWVQNDINWDRFHQNADELYRVLVNHQYNDGPVQQEAYTPIPLAAALKEEYPEIIRASRYEKIGMALPKGDEFITEKISFVESDFLKMFNIELIQGDINSAFTGPHNLIISEEMANKFFADEDPFGKTLTYKDIVLTVTGVAKNLPYNNSARFGFLLPFEFLMKPEMQKGIKNEWMYAFGSCLIELNKGADRKIVEDKIKNIIKRNNKDINAEIFLQNIKKIHLYSARKYFGEKNFLISNIIYVQLGSLIAVIILIIACINYMNIVTAQSARRAKEIGVRKVAGASRRKIIFQFLGETLLIVFVAHIIAMILVELLLPGFNNVMFRGASEMEVNYQSAGLYVGLITVVLFCGLLAGSYPALYLSSLKPSHILKGINDYTGNAKFRRILVISQFTMSFLFILCTLIIRTQLNYIQKMDLGLNMYNTAHFEFTEGIQRETLKSKLANNPDVMSVTITGHQNVLSNWAAVAGVNWKGKKAGDDIMFSFLHTDRDFAKTFQLELKQGSFLSSDEYSADNKDEFINIVINEKAAAFMGFKEPLGEVLLGGPSGMKLRIIGVVKDFHFKQLRYAIDPLIILPINPLIIGGICYIRMQPDHITSTVNDIRNIFKTYNLDYSPDVVFPDDDYDEMYIIEQKAGTMFGYISIVAIIISCLGLIGLSTYMTLRRTKEIGIRKANGAKLGEIFSLLSKEYIKLILISFVIASPIAWYATNIWLRSFAYRANISWWVFALALVIVMLITMLTVGFQSYKAANKNPIEALRYE